MNNGRWTPEDLDRVAKVAQGVARQVAQWPELQQAAERVRAQQPALVQASGLNAGAQEWAASVQQIAELAEVRRAASQLTASLEPAFEAARAYSDFVERHSDAIQQVVSGFAGAFAAATQYVERQPEVVATVQRLVAASQGVAPPADDQDLSEMLRDETLVAAAQELGNEEAFSQSLEEGLSEGALREIAEDEGFDQFVEDLQDKLSSTTPGSAQAPVIPVETAAAYFAWIASLIYLRSTYEYPEFWEFMEQPLSMFGVYQIIMLAAKKELDP
ncbi:hypothetical protein EHW97_14795 [Aeromicrobium camelliae]|uniref:Uncharacterized protein n=1 Tax=Aeromicrobium camelliae TaxID=1538144 RepID=A0A3N6W3H6_9ACTN|nr:hypothetical protein [Aeromicrobium camelliae]RQN02020.1 hypothetical protein EHW97_14795 [Aeromicrobium camelliae]